MLPQKNSPERDRTVVILFRLYIIIIINIILIIMIIIIMIIIIIYIYTYGKWLFYFCARILGILIYYVGQTIVNHPQMGGLIIMAYIF